MSVVSKLIFRWQESSIYGFFISIFQNIELLYQRTKAKWLKADRDKYKAKLQDIKRQLDEEQKK